MVSCHSQFIRHKTIRCLALLSFAILVTILFSSANHYKRNALLLKDPEKTDKIVLKLNKEDFNRGEKIKLKAYLVQGFGPKAVISSKTIYVELADALGEQFQLVKVSLKKGLTETIIQIQQSYAPGTYYIRAYSDLNNIKGRGFFFEQRIKVR